MKAESWRSMSPEPAQGGRRYQDLPDALDGIAHNMLTDTLWLDA
jgi:DNA-binding HxlR family transcriptional regulator